MTESSGDLLADRRFAWAMASARAGDHAAAAELLEQSLDIVPDWAPAWAALAEARESLGATALACAAWREVAARDKKARLGAPLHLARLAGETPATMPAFYVAALFDDYAPRFERHLVQDLRYRGPALILAAILAARPEARFGRALDLGCGTGLMGLALQGRVAEIDGIDLSARMIEAARGHGLYADLCVGALPEALDQVVPHSYDLVTAADVLVYIGDLGQVFAGARRALAPDGLFAATFQAHAGKGYRLGADLRFAHAPAYIAETARAAGLRLRLQREASTRTEKGADVPGLVVVAAPM